MWGPRAIDTRLLSPRNREVRWSASILAFFLFRALRLDDTQCDGHIQNRIRNIQQNKPRPENKKILVLSHDQPARFAPQTHRLTTVRLVLVQLFWILSRRYRRTLLLIQLLSYLNLRKGRHWRMNWGLAAHRVSLHRPRSHPTMSLVSGNMEKMLRVTLQFQSIWG